MANFTNWPVVALLFGVIFIFAFYGPIHRFLERANKIGSQGFEASSDSAAAQEKSATREQTVEGISSQADQLLRVFDNQLLLEGEKYIKADLDKRNITNPAERERVLIRLVSVTGTAALFERAYILMFWQSNQGTTNAERAPFAETRTCAVLCRSKVRIPKHLFKLRIRSVVQLHAFSNVYYHAGKHRRDHQ